MLHASSDDCRDSWEFPCVWSFFLRLLIPAKSTVCSRLSRVRKFGGFGNFRPSVDFLKLPRTFSRKRSFAKDNHWYVGYSACIQYAKLIDAFFDNTSFLRRYQGCYYIRLSNLSACLLGDLFSNLLIFRLYYIFAFSFVFVEPSMWKRREIVKICNLRLTGQTRLTTTSNNIFQGRIQLRNKQSKSSLPPTSIKYF